MRSCILVSILIAAIGLGSQPVGAQGKARPGKAASQKTAKKDRRAAKAAKRAKRKRAAAREGGDPAEAPPRPPSEMNTDEGALSESTLGLAALRDFIFSKIDYDFFYFSNIMKAKKRGQVFGNMSKEKFNEEVRRARSNVPVLERYTQEKDAHSQGNPFTLPVKSPGHRVYLNLLAMVNMIQALETKDYRAVRDFGNQVVISEKESLGQVRGEGVSYYLKLYREYFYLMGVASYRLGDDQKAVDWFARLEADADIMALKSKIESEEAPAPSSKAARLELLRIKPLAVVPFENIDTDPAMAWMSSGIMELLVSDLTQNTDVFVVERAQLDRLIGEISLGQLGVTDERFVSQVGQMVNAGTLIMGSFSSKGDTVGLELRLVATEDGEVLETASVSTEASDLAAGTRRALLSLMKNVGWLDEGVTAQLEGARVANAQTIRKLMEARLLMSTKKGEAKELFAQAMEDDPAYASLFEDLQSEFADISATVGVMSFVNTTGSPQDDWMVHGVSEALSSDLPKLNFNVVERAQLRKLIEEKVLEQQILDNETARDLGQQLGADFLVMGSIMHLSPRVRVDLRFVEVKTGMIVFSTSAEDPTDDFMAALVTLSTSIAERFNRALTDEEREQFAAKKMSKEDFEKHVREKLALESLERQREIAEGPPPPDPVKDKTIFTKVALGGSVAAALGAGAMLFVANNQYNKAQQAVDLRDRAASTDSRGHYQKQAERLSGQGNLAMGLGIGLGAVSVGAAAYAFYTVLEVEGIKSLDAPGEGPLVDNEPMLLPLLGPTGVGVRLHF